MQVQFHKYQGTGNDFIILENRHDKINLTKEKIKFLCNRRFGIGADGLMLLNTKQGYDFEMKYYNADGGESSMCGNGGRCIIKFAHTMGIHKNKYFFFAIDGEHEGTIELNNWVNLKMKNVNGITMQQNDFILNTGSPHLVKNCNDIKNIDVINEGRAIRYSKEFLSEGINVNFVEAHQKYISVRTYERGVEDETLSCGTGVTAAALVFAHNENGFNRIEVETPGGHLAVEFNKTGADNFENIWLRGPAEFVFKGEIEI